MLDTAKARRAHEEALRALTMHEFAMRDLGVPIGDAAHGPAEAAEEAVSTDRAKPASPADGGRRGRLVAKECETCGAGYEVDARAAPRSRYCPAHRTAAARKRANGRVEDPMTTIRSWSDAATTQSDH